MNRAVLPDLNPHEYEHVLDGQALDALKRIPGFDAIASSFSKHGLERFSTIQYTGSNLEVTANNYSELYSQLEEVCRILDLNTVPRLYVECGDQINALTVGSKEPIIVVSSGCIDRLTTDELMFVLGHECGHVKSLHGQYYSLAASASFLGELIGDYTLGIGKLISQPFKFALTRWSRFSELTCDRAGLLVCQDPDSAISTFIKIAGLPERFSESVFHGSFLEQAKRFESIDFEKASKLVKVASSLGRTHPWTVLRASELMKWIESGEYETIMSRTSGRRVNVRYEESYQFCRNCGYRLKGHEAFCPSCGATLNS